MRAPGAPDVGDEHRRRIRELHAGGIVSIPLRRGVRVRPGESAANSTKHGIGFVQAQALWDDPNRVEVPARTLGEPRWLVVGRIAGLHWSAAAAIHRRDSTKRRCRLPTSSDSPGVAGLSCSTSCVPASLKKFPAGAPASSPRRACVPGWR
ncbi:MAG: BrnT family toxin [Acidimicrobiales bacterium]